MAFKMKRTPIKGLSDFFSSLGKEATSVRQTNQKASNTGEYAGMTNFEKRRAEKKSRKAGESKFQADVRKNKENKKQSYSSKSKPSEEAQIKAADAKFKKGIEVSSAKQPKATKKKVSYADAYKNADKKKYPTLALFTAAAKEYNANKKK